MRRLRYRGFIYSEVMFPYTLEVQHSLKDPKEFHRMLFDLIKKAPAKTVSELGSMEMSWRCRSETECQQFQKRIQLMKFPGVIVDYYPAI